ncbi:MAG: glycosyltransferase family 4 protein [Thermodesulfobacteriota bacterium]
MVATAALYYRPEGFDTGGRRLMGRHSAGAGMLQGLVRHGAAGALFCHADTPRHFDDFRQRIAPHNRQGKAAVWVRPGDAAALAGVGALHLPMPGLGEQAWVRRHAGQRGWSVTGLVHTLCSREALASLAGLLTAPVQPWDALVCTSAAARTVVERVLEDHAGYLESRVGARPACPVRLPVIPLGVDSADFAARGRDPERRARLRADLGMAENDVAALFFGRLIFYAKAHPVPMYLALERVAARVAEQGGRLWLLHVGWFENEKEKQAFLEAPAAFCPSVRSVFLNGRAERVADEAWAAADFFVSLPDNLQETFGLTPIEAMAAGLPVLGADWDGYRDTVRHGRDGFLVPAIAPGPGGGPDLAADYAADALNYSTYVGHAAMATAVDVAACAEFAGMLATDAGLRRRLGESGMARAREAFDWKVVVAAHEALWAELAEIRKSASEIAPVPSGGPASSLLDDPFRAFAGYATAELAPDTRLVPGDVAAPGRLALLRRTWMTSFGESHRAAPVALDQVLVLAREQGGTTVAAALDALAPRDAREAALALRGLGWLLKFDVLRRAVV